MNALFNKRFWTEIIALLILNIVNVPKLLVMTKKVRVLDWRW